MKQRIARLAIVVLAFVFIVSLVFWWAVGDPAKETLRAVAGYATLVGLGLAIYQIYSATRLNENLQLLAASTSTRYVGVFPDNMDSIIQLVKRTRYKLTVITDAVGYGHFSAPERFEVYRAELRKLKANRNASIAMVVYNGRNAERAREEQLGVMATEGFQEFQQSDALKKYSKWAPEKASRMMENESALQRVLAENEVAIFDSLIECGIEVFRTDRDIPMFMWISDHQRAIICMLARQKNALEYAFETRDSKLIDALDVLASGYLSAIPRGVENEE